MSPDDILIPISDKEGSIMGCFHVPFLTWKTFVARCEALGVNPGEKLKEFLKEFVNSKNEKKDSVY